MWHVFFDKFEGHLAEDFLDLLLQISHATFAAIKLYESVEGAVADADVLWLDTRLIHQERYQILLHLKLTN